MTEPVYLCDLVSWHQRLELEAGWPPTRPLAAMRAIVEEQCIRHHVTVMEHAGVKYVELSEGEGLVRLLAGLAAAQRQQREKLELASLQGYAVAAGIFAAPLDAQETGIGVRAGRAP